MHARVPPPPPPCMHTHTHRHTRARKHTPPWRLAPYLTGIVWLSPGTSDKAPPSPPHAFSQLRSEQSPWMLSTNAAVRSFQLLMYAPSAHRASQLAPAEPPTASVYLAGKSGFGAGGSGLAALLLPTATVGSRCCAASSAWSSGGGSPLGAGVGNGTGGATGSPAALHASDGLNGRQATSCHRGRGKTSRTFRRTWTRVYVACVHGPTHARTHPCTNARTGSRQTEREQTLTARHTRAHKQSRAHVLQQV